MSPSRGRAEPRRRAQFAPMGPDQEKQAAKECNDQRCIEAKECKHDRRERPREDHRPRRDGLHEHQPRKRKPKDRRHKPRRERRPDAERRRDGLAASAVQPGRRRVPERRCDGDRQETPAMDAKDPESKGRRGGAFGRVKHERGDADPPAARLPRIGRARVPVAHTAHVRPPPPANKPDRDRNRSEDVAQNAARRRKCHILQHARLDLHRPSLERGQGDDTGRRGNVTLVLQMPVPTPALEREEGRPEHHEHNDRDPHQEQQPFQTFHLFSPFRKRLRCSIAEEECAGRQGSGSTAFPRAQARRSPESKHDLSRAPSRPRAPVKPALVHAPQSSASTVDVGDSVPSRLALVPTTFWPRASAGAPFASAHIRPTRATPRADPPARPGSRTRLPPASLTEDQRPPVPARQADSASRPT